MCQREAVEPAVEFRRLGRTELSRVVEIDRREDIDEDVHMRKVL